MSIDIDLLNYLAYNCIYTENFDLLFHPLGMRTLKKTYSLRNYKNSYVIMYR